MKIRYKKELFNGHDDIVYELFNGHENIVYDVLHITNTFSFSHERNRFGVPVGDSPTATYFLVASKNNNSFFWIADYDCELVSEEG